MNLEGRRLPGDLHLWVIPKAEVWGESPRGVWRHEQQPGAQQKQDSLLSSNGPTCNLPLHQGLTGTYTNPS